MKSVTITHPKDRYENIFNMYELTNDNGNSYVFYNILNKVTIPQDIDPAVFEFWSVPGNMALTTISYRIYGTISLWWLICTINHITNPVSLLAPGSVIKVIKKEYIPTVLNSLTPEQNATTRLV